MNPVALIPFVEIIPGPQTSEDTLQSALRLLADMGMEGIVVCDSPGFVSNRVLMLTLNEAIRVVEEELAPVRDVDRIFRSCFGHKMGPLETADLIGLDTVLYSLQVLDESNGGDKYEPCPLLEKMVRAGLHGRKSGRGFYTYTMQEPKRSDQAGEH
jgi:3-hydroxybutyryl-CoA dehydrogenase